MLLVAGCSGLVGSEAPSSTPNEPFEPVHSPATGPCAKWTAFWGASDPDAHGYTQGAVRIGYALPANTTALFVAFEGNRSLGFSQAGPYGQPVSADGAAVRLSRHLTGTHTVRVVAYNDTNGNRQFDRGIDRPCYAEGDIVETGPHTFDFGQFPTATAG